MLRPAEEIGARFQRHAPEMLAAAVVLGALSLVMAMTHAGRALAAGFRSQCSDRYSPVRDPSNPLALPAAPGADPLNGATFFVPGPAKGAAAQAIAQLVEHHPQRLRINESWSEFARHISTRADIAANRSLAHQVTELSKIAAQPESQRVSAYSEGGSPAGVFGQTQKILCQNHRADPGSITIFNTYFLHAKLGACPKPAAVRAYTPLFHRQISAMTAAVGRRPAVFLLEIDAIGSSRCIQKVGSLKLWEADLSYELTKVGALPHTVVYVEGGYSDGNPVGYTARVLNAIHVNRIRGFFTNDTHENWTMNEIRWGTRIAERTHGAHFIVNTADNGRGPLLNHNRVRDGNADLCNPPGRGLGPLPTTSTGFPYVDAYMWTHPPGNSSGCGGGPPAGRFWPARAVMLAENANQQLGPGLPSRPY